MGKQLVAVAKCLTLKFSHMTVTLGSPQGDAAQIALDHCLQNVYPEFV